MMIRGIQRRFAGDLSELMRLQCESLQLACIGLTNIIFDVYRFVEGHREETFEVINELLEDKTLKFSMLAGQGPVWEREENGVKKGVKIELIHYWEEEARKGRTIEEAARYNSSLLIISNKKENFC